MRLSILIPHVPGARTESLAELMDVLEPQLGDDAEVIIDDTPPPVSTGAKLNALYAKAQGDYVTQVADDDLVPEYYVEAIIEAAAADPDFIGWRQQMTHNGVLQDPVIIRPDLPYENAGGEMRRSLCVTCPIRREIGASVKFPDRTYGEDRAWEHAVLPKVRTWTFIDRIMYHYRYSSDGSLARANSGT